MSKSPSRRPVRLQGKLKNEREKNLHIPRVLLHFAIFHCTSLQPMLMADLR
jgi:hypothetical protein